MENSNELRQRLRENTRSFREGLKAAGLTVAGDDHPICPVMVGEAPLAVELASGMLGKIFGVFLNKLATPYSSLLKTNLKHYWLYHTKFLMIIKRQPYGKYRWQCLVYRASILIKSSQFYFTYTNVKY